VYHHRLLLGLLGTIDIGPCGAVDDDVGALGLQLRRDAGGVGDVELRMAEADHVVAGVAGGEHDVAAEHSGGPCDQHLHQVSLISELSPTSKRSVFGMPSLRVSFTFRPSRLASIRVPRSSTTEPARTIECSTSERRMQTP